MNKYQIAKLDSYNLIVKEARNNKEATDSIPAFAKGIDRLEAITLVLEKIKVDQERDITGIAADKSDIQEDLCDYLLDIAGAIYSYAEGKNDSTLMAKVDYKPRTIEKMLQADIISACENVKLEAAKVPAADLAEGGITTEDMETFATLLDNYKEIKPSPREAVIERSAHTENIKELFNEATKLVKNKLERLASQFKRKNPAFYLKYKAARNIIYKRPATPGKEKTTLV